MTVVPEAPLDAVVAPTAPVRRSRGQLARYLFDLIFDDTLADHAATLTFYAVLAALPTLTTMLAIVGALNQSVTDPLVDEFRTLGPGPGAQLLIDTLHELRGSALSAPLILLGLPVTLWILTRYLGALVQGIQSMYGIVGDEPRKRTILLRAVLAAVAFPLLACCLVAVVTTGEMANGIGERLGLGEEVAATWPILKWPLLLAAMTFLVVLLYRLVLHGHGTRYRRLARGSLLALTVWLTASLGFTLYVEHFGSYSRLYGSLAAAVILLVWVWITHFALLLGAAYNAPDPGAVPRQPTRRLNRDGTASR
ncbi:YihY/virulence factor BrkB family protein [Nocardia sp. NPDC057227]|uniref:YihY/virulence factor BrkB family protein n=1 Tax=Nocardia sp. NPDC057227 TaxID=3346056 RepID=UPI003640F309